MSPSCVLSSSHLRPESRVVVWCDVRVFLSAKSSSRETEVPQQTEVTETPVPQQAAVVETAEAVVAEPEPSQQAQSQDVDTPVPDAGRAASKEEVVEVVEESKVAQTDEVDEPTRGKRDKIPPPLAEEATNVLQEVKPQVAEVEGK